MHILSGVFVYRYFEQARASRVLIDGAMYSVMIRLCARDIRDRDLLLKYDMCTRTYAHKRAHATSTHTHTHTHTHIHTYVLSTRGCIRL